ncbi:MAG TPA: efflux RND transporter permease subunit [Micropepsaceae bacterium]|nr:efflux RND transporter permease subunit [Micropepsaceae bacterium]
MNVSEIFIKRPVMTILVTLAVLIAGVFGYRELPAAELPSIDFPSLVVSAGLPGADPETMAAAVATPLEAQFSLIPGLDSMSSINVLGSTQITLQFRLDRSIDAAQQDVQGAISEAGRTLPTNLPTPPAVRKVNPAESSVLQITVTSQTLPLAALDEYAETVIVRALSTIDGVADVDIFGQAHPAVRIQVDPFALAVRGIGIDQVANAVRTSNVDLATGQLDGRSRSAVIQAQGQLIKASDYQRQIITYRNGAPVRFSDVARVIDGVDNPRLAGLYNGRLGVILGVNRQPGVNTIALIDRIKAAMPRIRAQLPQSIDVELTLDRSDSIRAAIHDVQTTLLVATILVVGVIFLFLRTAAATFIPSIALPVTIAGTFAGMAAFGYNLDNLSLMALTLCVGFVVDDAIVMLENIMRHVEAGENPYYASLKGSREIAFTILSMTVSLAAVFIPVLFMGGIVGRLLHEFAVTIVIAIVVSGLVSITLTPMLCSRMLTDAGEEAKKRRGAFYRLTESGFNHLRDGYERSLRWSLNHKAAILGLFAASIVATVVLFRALPEDFLPSDDIGQLTANTEGANGISFAEMMRHQMQAAQILWSDPNVSGAMTAVGSGGARSGVNQGTFRIALKPRAQRLSIDGVMAELRRKFAGIPGINIYLQNRPILTIGGLISKAQYQYTLTDTDAKELYAASTRFHDALSKVPGLLDVSSDLDLTTPSLHVDVDRDRASALGVSMQEIETALGASFGGQQISLINTNSDQIHVILELLPQYQEDADALQRLYLTGSGSNSSLLPFGAAATSALVPFGAVAKLSNGTSPLAVNHFGELPAVTISFSLPPGVALSDALDKIDQVKSQIGLPAGVQGEFQGTARAFQDSMQGMGYLLLGAILVVYIVLGILYESFIHPLTILSGLPSAAVGALFTLYVFGSPLTLYAFVGMIMLVGIVKKNAIMMIDFALAREREHGADARTAITEAAVIRFRPIMMTTLAALMGSLPIAFGLGQGGAGRQPLGLAVVGGLVLSQALTLYITPVIYGYLDVASNWTARLLTRNVPASAE